MEIIEMLIENLSAISWQMIVMWIIGGILIYLAIKKDMEPTLLLPMGFGAILVNLPFSSVIAEEGVLTTLFNAGIA
ncbi:MAG: sodium ion-translocating decarboxylase subunit beta, partial [Clostridia bacterium]|nr:sodium ion-translocating decarboxylase subunit beta [Clostridia bacterium]